MRTESTKAAPREHFAPCPLPVARGLNRAQAAAYIGVSPSLFDEMIGDGRMPAPKRMNSRTVWDRLALDRAFDKLPGGTTDDAGAGEWDVEL
ncbi:hypothetical protein Q9316_17005 [Shinella zoogloeoides]|nr:hypothetical protein [Shinella zoogloeoides]WLR92144.1 hypothetical protein Q9316_17005 [Shinella zoogloeoides]